MDIKRIVALAAIVAVVAAFFALDLQRFLTLDYFKAERARIDEYCQAQPVRTAAAFFVAYVAVTALSIPGAAIMTLAGGAVFGLLAGTLLVSFASSIGATLAFLVSRLLLRDWVQRRLGRRLHVVNDGVTREGAFYLFALRLVPIFPFWLVNLAMGLTTIRPWTFYWVSQVGMLGGTIVYVYAGMQLGRFQISSGLVVAFALLGVFPLAAKKTLDALKSRTRPV